MAQEYKRKSIPKKTRFEVFKRDSFTCQYCGSKAPDVVLEIDHIEPVSKGGTNDLINLVTACFDCNRGKSSRKLSDKTVIAQQQEELEELNERRIQLEMMMEWRKELMKLDDDKLDLIVEAIEDLSGYELCEPGIQEVKKWVRRFDFSILLDSIEAAIDQYEDFEHAFTMIPRIANNKSSPHKIFEYELKYIVGILYNRCNINKSTAREYLTWASGYLDLGELREIAVGVDRWRSFKEIVEDRIGDSDGN